MLSISFEIILCIATFLQITDNCPHQDWNLNIRVENILENENKNFPVINYLNFDIFQLGKMDGSNLSSSWQYFLILQLTFMC